MSFVRNLLLASLGGHDFSHVSKLVVDSLVYDVLAVNSRELVIMPVHDQGVDDQVFKTIVMTLNDEVFESTKTVAVGCSEVALRSHVVIVPVDCG